MRKRCKTVSGMSHLFLNRRKLPVQYVSIGKRLRKQAISIF